MKRQFVSEVGVYSAAWNSKKATDLIAAVKCLEHALLSDDEELPSKAVYQKIYNLCSKLDKVFPKTLPLQVEHSRDKFYGGMRSVISIKPTRRDGSFSDSYWIMIYLIDVKRDFDYTEDPVKEESLLINSLFMEGGAQ